MLTRFSQHPNGSTKQRYRKGINSNGIYPFFIHSFYSECTNGSIVGSGGWYWGSSPIGISAYGLYFDGGDEYVSSSYRKDGYSVRGVVD